MSASSFINSPINTRTSWAPTPNNSPTRASRVNRAANAINVASFTQVTNTTTSPPSRNPINSAATGNNKALPRPASVQRDPKTDDVIKRARKHFGRRWTKPIEEYQRSIDAKRHKRSLGAYGRSAFPEKARQEPRSELRRKATTGWRMQRIWEASNGPTGVRTAGWPAQTVRAGRGDSQPTQNDGAKRRSMTEGVWV